MSVDDPDLLTATPVAGRVHPGSLTELRGTIPRARKPEPLAATTDVSTLITSYLVYRSSVFLNRIGMVLGVMDTRRLLHVAQPDRLWALRLVPDFLGAWSSRTADDTAWLPFDGPSIDIGRALSRLYA